MAALWRPVWICFPGRDGPRAVPLTICTDSANRFLARRSIIVLPVMVAMMAMVLTVIVTRIIGGAIVDASVIVIISVPGITVAALIIAGCVITRCDANVYAEILSLRF